MQFDITIIDINTRTAITERIDSPIWPVICDPHTLQCGTRGIPIQIKRVAEVSGSTTPGT